jgi:hypothetical protein
MSKEHNQQYLASRSKQVCCSSRFRDREIINLEINRNLSLEQSY